MDVEKARLEKLEKLRNMSDQVRIGGKGTARRKKKVIHKNAAVDDKKLQSTLKKLNLNTIPTIEEVNMYKADGTLIHFKNPKVQASPQANVFAVSGQAETKPLTDLFPNMLNQLESAKLRLSKMSEAKNDAEAKPEDFDEDVPELVEDFDEKSRLE
ncbi:NAC domain protein [Opisthorchis viverrini]|uniref:Transcription factor BTF3 n=1 Tax=Opisthorchis viverrini TaxID=6198 RepID=A0A1S8X599_OPIVI|nr:NAC domain protein [Opisthorchis viverrini]